MNIEQQIERLKLQYNVLAVVPLDPFFELGEEWLYANVKELHKVEYAPSERIVFTVQTKDTYKKNVIVGNLIIALHFALAEIDITPCFVILLTTNENIHNELLSINGKDMKIIESIVCNNETLITPELKNKTKVRNPHHNFKWNERTPVYINADELTKDQQYKVIESDNFCMIPWIHIHGWPTGEAYPCCLGEGEHPIGNFKKQTLKEIWNGEPYKLMRKNMLEDKPSKECVRCYEQEKNGFSSMRINTNRHFAQHITEIDKTLEDGTVPEMVLRYWDIRFSNICNLKCRTCGGIFSNKWYDDEVLLNNGKPMRDRILYAGKSELDIWEQMKDQIQNFDQIYFAGGEPMIMEEHYRILDKLIETGNTNVRLVYNTNLTALRHKGKFAIDYWKQFPNVCVAASLDGMFEHAELIRAGTKWDKVEQNIQDIKRECPHIDFLISPTLSVMNVWHLPEFHKYMIDKGYIKPMDMNVNILQSPENYRIDILPAELKEEIRELYNKHIEYLEPLDNMKRAVNGMKSALQFMDANDNSKLIPEFWKTALKLDKIRKEDITSVIPQLARLKSE
jgi:organic radical activating enzyme